MEIKTKSGIEVVNKKTAYGKWVIGYTQTDAWSGWYTISQIWDKYKTRNQMDVRGKRGEKFAGSSFTSKKAE